MAVLAADVAAEGRNRADGEAGEASEHIVASPPLPLRERAGERGSPTRAFEQRANDRADSASPSIEIVATHEAGDIVLYIDDWASNAPLTGLQVDLVAGTQCLRAAADSRGGYRLPADLLDDSATSTITVQYSGGGIEGTATVALSSPALGAAARPSSTSQAERPRPSTWIAALTPSALVLLATAWTLHRRRRRSHTGTLASIP